VEGQSTHLNGVIADQTIVLIHEILASSINFVVLPVWGSPGSFILVSQRAILIEEDGSVWVLVPDSLVDIAETEATDSHSTCA
jgi:hypothetical protein